MLYSQNALGYSMFLLLHCPKPKPRIKGAVIDGILTLTASPSDTPLPIPASGPQLSNMPHIAPQSDNLTIIIAWIQSWQVHTWWCPKWTFLTDWAGRNEEYKDQPKDSFLHQILNLPKSVNLIYYFLNVWHIYQIGHFQSWNSWWERQRREFAFSWAIDPDIRQTTSSPDVCRLQVWGQS